MTPLELVTGSSVTKVVRRAGSEFVVGPGSRGRTVPAIDYTITVALPDGREIKLIASSKTAWRRVVRKAGLKLTSKAAKSAAASLREMLEKAVNAEKNRPGAAALDSLVLEKTKARWRKREKGMEAALRLEKLDRMRALMRETKLSREEVLKIWGESVVEDVMKS